MSCEVRAYCRPDMLPLLTIMCSSARLNLSQVEWDDGRHPSCGGGCKPFAPCFHPDTHCMHRDKPLSETCTGESAPCAEKAFSCQYCVKHTRLVTCRMEWRPDVVECEGPSGKCAPCHRCLMKTYVKKAGVLKGQASCYHPRKMVGTCTECEKCRHCLRARGGKDLVGKTDLGGKANLGGKSYKPGASYQACKTVLRGGKEHLVCKTERGGKADLGGKRGDKGHLAVASGSLPYRSRAAGAISFSPPDP